MARSSEGSRSSPEALVKALSVLARVINQVLDDYAVSRVTRMPLAGSKVQLLKLVAHQGDQAIGHAAKFLGVSDPAVSQLVDSLATQKLVSRRPDPRDRRTAFLRLTPAGRRFVGALERQQQNLAWAALKKVGITSPATWIATVQELSRALAKSDPKIYEQCCLQCTAHQDTTCLLDNGYTICPFLVHSEERLRRLESKGKRSGRKQAAGRGARTRT